MEKELGLMRQAAKGYGDTAHGQFDDTYRLWLQQCTGTGRLDVPHLDASVHRMVAGLVVQASACKQQAKHSKETQTKAVPHNAENSRAYARAAAGSSAASRSSTRRFAASARGKSGRRGLPPW